MVDELKVYRLLTTDGKYMIDQHLYTFLLYANVF